MIGELYRRRFRGFRVIELGAFVVVVVLAFGVYLAKTQAGREWAQIATKERRIAEERRRIKLLRAEVAHLEQPQRLEQLSAHLGLQAVDGTREARPETLRDIVDPAEKPAAVTPAPGASVQPPAPIPAPAPETPR